MFGVLNINKPKGITSHDVVAIVRKILGIKQIGHSGTLDPFAQGVLPLFIGKATKLIDYCDSDKEYLAEIQFGSSTDTYDIEGNIVSKSDKKIAKEDVQNALSFFEGEISQLPPIYSAIKVNGKKLYEYARNGEDVVIKPRKVFIHDISLQSFNEQQQTAEILVKCSKGTYIRSIANDLGEKLGCGSYLINLVRTRTGKFIIEESVNLPITFSLDENKNSFKKYIINENALTFISDFIKNPIEYSSLKKYAVNDIELEKIRHGNPIKIEQNLLKSGDFLILVYNNNVVAIGEYNNGQLKVKKVFL